MEKISRIVPNSSRVTAVDMKKERPVRASAPGFGAPVSESTNRGPKKHAVVEATRTHNELYGPNAKVSKEAEIAKRMTDDFFVNQSKAQPASLPPEEALPGEDEFIASVVQGRIDEKGSESDENVMSKGPYSIRV